MTNDSAPSYIHVGRNGIFHGPGKCNCRAVVRSADGGTTFGELTFDPVRTTFFPPALAPAQFL